jgi:ribosomal protein S18 acetylase RimI-like enzyme
MNILCLTPEEAADRVPELCALLQNVVDAGASVGFLPPLAYEEARDYWTGVVARIGPAERLLFVALDGDAVVGTVQLYLESRPNGRHRGEVNKLLVHSDARRRGVATELMQTLHEAAVAAGRSLLVLDTLVGENAERLYRRLGYVAAGIIPRYARNGAGGLDATVYMYKDFGVPEPGAARA